jgi:hypothetical protein
MPYVMLPVPEEHVNEVMQFVLRAVAKASVEPWDDPSINEVYNEIDEVSRSLLAFVARASVGGVDISAEEAAKKIQMTVRETAGIQNELMALSRDRNRPNLLESRGVQERLANGRVVEKRILLMTPEIADLIRAAEEAEIAAARGSMGQVGE